MERVEAEEMLDLDHWSPEQVACALGAIRRVNRLYGGDRMHKRLFRRVASRMGPRRMEILEVASARGEVVQAAARMLRKRNIPVSISLLDRSDMHLPGSGEWDRSLPQPTLLVGDALEMPLEDGSVDVVSCCLFLHHLSAGAGAGVSAGGAAGVAGGGAGERCGADAGELYFVADADAGRSERAVAA